MKYQIPDSWARITLEKLFTFVLGGDWGKDEDFDDPGYEKVLCIRASELRNWEVERGETAALRKIKKSSLEKRELYEGDILVEISGGGPDQPVGRTVLIDKAALSKSPTIKKICTNFFRLARPIVEIDSSYLNHYLQHFYKSGNISEYQAGSNNLRNLKFNDYLQIEIPTAPLNEQKRIVAKIEELFSELDNGIAALKTAREQLKVYRQAVLKHAFEGKLTAKWREKNADKLESPEQLLARIQQEREARYQQRLEEWKAAVKTWEANGREGKKPKKPRPLDLSVSDESTPEFQLPKGWIWCKVRNLISDLTDYHANGSYEVLKENIELKDDPDYALMVRATNFEKNNFESDQKYINKSAYEFLSKSKLFGGEILVGKIGNAGKVYFMPYLNRPASLAMNLFCLRFEGLRSTFIYNQLMSARASEQIKSYVKGVGNPTIDKKALRSIDIALPCEAEQEYLIEKIGNIFSQIERVETEIQTNLDKSEILRQSILKKAFSGQLVPQDPNDEPASELLARIQAEKSAQKASAKPKAAAKTGAKRGRKPKVAS